MPIKLILAVIVGFYCLDSLAQWPDASDPQPNKFQAVKLPTATNPAPVAPKDPNHFYDKKTGISIDKPYSWNFSKPHNLPIVLKGNKLNENKNPKFLVSFSPGTYEPEYFPPIANVQILPTIKPSDSLLSLLEQIVKSESILNENHFLVSAPKISVLAGINSASSEQIYYTIRGSRKIKIHTFKWVFFATKKAYLLLIQCQEDELDQWRTTIDQVANSLKITN